MPIPSSILHPVILLQNVCVRYRVPEEQYWSFKEYAIRLLQRKVRMHDFWALRNINLEVHRGECLGIIGPNGAGKSTLLKVVARVLSPTEGRIQVDGEVSPLLELGAGFHAELTGRENIYLNGTLLGHTRREINEHMQEILDFAQIGSFIEAPLRTYSSGMVARLGFAVATSWQPEILILDETLAVGDEAFRGKCYIRMESFISNGTTILMVSHDLSAVQLKCGRAVWLDKGLVRMEDRSDLVVAAYQDSGKIGCT